ncbi:MAG: murein biosynthesis integral membrane protein MurJ, partial [Stellaceae bacterium]
MALIRTVATLGSYTMVSRVLGFVREILTADFLGASNISDAFFVALRLPNMFRSLFAEGAFSVAFVPIFAGKVATDGAVEAKRFAEEALAVLLVALLLFLILGEFAAPWILDVIAPGFRANPAKFALALDLTRIMFPYLLFLSLVALQGGILNSLERFAAAAITPVLLNIFLIATLLGVRPLTGQALAWAVTGAGLAQFLWLMFSCQRAGMALSLPVPRLTPELKRLLRIMVPGVFGAGVTQINLLVSTAIASLLPVGSVSFLYYADRLNQLPLAVIGIAIGTAILPGLSRQVRTGDNAAANLTQNRGLELALLLTLPAAVALAVAAHPILKVLFQHGRFSAADAQATAGALIAYAAGLPAFVVIKVMAPGFYARHDTRTPVTIGAVAVAINIALTIGLGLGTGLAHVGVAMATSIAGWVNALALTLVLSRRGLFSLDRGARRRLPRLVLAAIGTGGVVLVLEYALSGALAGSLALRIAALALLVGGGITAFFLLALAFAGIDRGDLLR